MLVFYDRLTDIPDDVQIIKSNDSYFNAHTNINDSVLTNRILKEIDKAERIDLKSFKGRSEHFGTLDKQFLSTGTKTLINIISFPSICFNLVECGYNALGFIPLIHDGMVFSEKYLNIPVTSENVNCSIIYRGKEWTNLNDFIEYYSEVYNEENLYEI